MRPARSGRNGSPRERGLAFVVAIVVVLAIASMLLVFARRMQTEAVASANHLAAVRARLIAEGVARALVADLAQSEAGSMGPSVDNVKVEAGELGGGLYWIIQPGDGDDRQRVYGLVREAGKANINNAPLEMLRMLPGMNGEIAAAVVDWRDGDMDPVENGAESEYYLARRPAYSAKNAPFETVGELRLVRGVDEELLYGEDRNHNGFLDAGENNADATPPPDNADGRLGPGLVRYTTIYSREPNVSAATGRERININEADEDEIEEALRTVLSEERADDLADRIDDQEPYANMIEFIADAELEEDEAPLLLDLLTTSDEEMLVGRIDATAAPAGVFDALPELEPGDGETLVSARAGASAPGDTWQWVIDALGREKAVAVGDRLTLRCFQFSADIVAVSGDGRAFYRWRVVFDAADDPPRIVYAEDRTALGWPLAPEILSELRSNVPAGEVALRYASGAGR